MQVDSDVLDLTGYEVKNVDFSLRYYPGTAKVHGNTLFYCWLNHMKVSVCEQDGSMQ